MEQMPRSHFICQSTQVRSLKSMYSTVSAMLFLFLQLYIVYTFPQGDSTLYADHQDITGFIGDSVRIWFHSGNSGGMKWCRPNWLCATDSLQSISGTNVAFESISHDNFTVTMSGLSRESSGWYYFVKGDLQMPVHLTVTEKPSTSKYNISVDYIITNCCHLVLRSTTFFWIIAMSSPTTHRTTASVNHTSTTVRPGQQRSDKHSLHTVV